MDFMIEAIGWLGCFLILIAYFALSQKKWSVHSQNYIFFNIAGATFVLLNALAHRAWPIVILEALWAIVGLKNFLKVRKMHVC